MIILEMAYHGNTTTLIDLSPYKYERAGGRPPPDTTHKVSVVCKALSFHVICGDSLIFSVDYELKTVRFAIIYLNWEPFIAMLTRAA